MPSQYCGAGSCRISQYKSQAFVNMSERKRILITVKTYPTLSYEYDELVCTAGVLEDGSWIRLSPIPFRRMDYEKQFKKYQWIEIDVSKRREDMRPESFIPDEYYGYGGFYRHSK